MSDEMTALRMSTIKMGLEAEMNGFRLTSKAPRCFKIIEIEFGIKAKRSAQGKRVAYEEFCKRFGFTPKTDKGATDGGAS